jgi:ketosteroid isomerase-like protein
MSLGLESAFKLFLKGISTRDLSVMKAVSDPDIEFTSYFGGLEAKTYHGHPGLSEYLEDLPSAWEYFRLTLNGFTPVGPDKGVVEVHVLARARTSGVEFDERHFGFWEFRNEKALRGRTYASREGAFQAAGAAAMPQGPRLD